MSGLVQTVDLLTTGLIRHLLTYIGIYEPLERGLLFAVLSVLWLFWFRPLRSFTEDGDPRPWVFYDETPLATWMPWWLEVFWVSMIALLFI